MPHTAPVTHALRFFHVSPLRFEAGTMLLPGGGDMARTTFPESAPNWVYLNTSPYPHLSMRPYPVWKNWHIHTVSPVDGVWAFATQREAVCRSARVDGYIGRVNDLKPDPALFEGVYHCLSDEDLAALGTPGR